MDPWIKLMESFMENLKTTDKIKVEIFLNHLTKEAKSYIQAKPNEHTATPETDYELLRKLLRSKCQ